MKADNQPAIWTIDTFGRRNLLLFTFPMMAIMLFWAGSAFYMDVSSPHRVPLIAAGKLSVVFQCRIKLTSSGLRIYRILLSWNGSCSIRVCPYPPHRSQADEKVCSRVIPPHPPRSRNVIRRPTEQFLGRRPGSHIPQCALGFGSEWDILPLCRNQSLRSVPIPSPEL
jgi:hypothetical protein